VVAVVMVVAGAWAGGGGEVKGEAFPQKSQPGRSARLLGRVRRHRPTRRGS